MVVHLIFQHIVTLTHWGRNKMDDISHTTFSSAFLMNIWIPIKISLKFVPKGPIDDIPALVQIMAWSRPGGKPLSEPMMVSLPTHIWVTRLNELRKYYKLSYCIPSKFIGVEFTLNVFTGFVVRDRLLTKCKDIALHISDWNCRPITNNIITCSF